MVRQVKSLAEFNAALSEAGNKLVVVDFTATWCGPCRVIGPKFAKLSEASEYNNVVFLKVDVDEAAVSVSTYFTAIQQMKCARCNRLKRSVRAWWLGGFDSLLFLQDVSSSCGISCMPTFHFYKNGKKIAEFSGADENKLKEKLNQLK
uniref:Thioredoxin domain-containing protein n=1 Tax=Anabas testudineus TaxID=64144 RepID=A0AAQ6IQY1_ANATE